MIYDIELINLTKTSSIYFTNIFNTIFLKFIS